VPVKVILSSLSNPSWLENPSILIQNHSKIDLTKKQSQSLFDGARKALESDDFLAAANFLYTGLMLDESRFLLKIQKDGILRSSRYSYQKKQLSSLVVDLNKPDLRLSSAVLEYLDSLSHLYVISGFIRKEYEKIKDWLSSEREVGIKSALAALDFLFLRQVDGFNMGDKGQNSRNPLFFTVEELAGGFSSILALYGNEFGELRGNCKINQEASNKGYYYDMLISAAHLSAFREWEFQVDRMGYRLSRIEEKNEFILSHPSQDFLRAVDMGFISSFTQRVFKPLMVKTVSKNSFKKLGKKMLHALEKNGFVTLEGTSFPRYVFKFPEDILRITSQINEFLQEEEFVLMGTCRDLLTPFDKLVDLKIGKDLTFRDIFLVSRLMQIMRSVIAAKLFPVIKENRGVVFESLIPAFERDKLTELIGLVIGKHKAKTAIDMLTTDMSGYIDIQYQPLLPAGKAILLPTNIFSNSNIYRNPMMVLGTRLYEDGSIDPLGDKVQGAFHDIGASSKPSVHYSWNSTQGEVDVLVSLGNFLFAFECKNSLLPTGFHELMTSLDYIYTAAKQLDRFKQAFEDTEFRDRLALDTGLSIGSRTHLVTGIIMSNRMFIGLRINGHPVRGNFELENFIKEGTVTMGDESRCFWIDETFSGEDLRRFLEEDITYQLTWAAMKNYVMEYILDGGTLKEERMKLDMIDLADKFGFKKASLSLRKEKVAYDRWYKKNVGKA